ncbi:hypothetical protein V1478_000535, partial [Vespula squamosa]
GANVKVFLIILSRRDNRYSFSTLKNYLTTRTIAIIQTLVKVSPAAASTTPFWHATCPSTESKTKKTKSLGGKEEEGEEEGEEEEEEEEEKERAIEKVNLKAVLGGRWLVGAGCDEVCINKQKLSCCCLG